jgi:3-isopropylmalate dehydrogenase
VGRRGLRQRPEAGLLRLRKDLALYANLRPAICYPALAEASALKRELVDGLDILIVRELTGGVYFGEPKTIVDLGNGQKRAIDTQVYDTYEIERVARVAFELARTRQNKVHSAEKRNVMKSGVLWHEVVSAVHREAYADVELNHILADNCAMQLVRRPKQFDVIVTDNLFGDILSDVAAMLTGSLGMLPSASLGAADEATGRRKALYEPVHGSAPDIAGQGLANPIAMIASFAMALRYSFGLKDWADRLDQAIAASLAKGLRTADIMQDGMARSAPPRWGQASWRNWSGRRGSPHEGKRNAGRAVRISLAPIRATSVAVSAGCGRGLRAARACGRACGPGGWLPPVRGRAARRVSRSGREASSRETRLRAAASSSAP